MAALERGIEWLRPLVNNHPWDYCVVWKLGDDPSRFIEWGACCCSGGRRGVGMKIKGENFVDECKDKVIKHPVTSNACKKLAQLPSVIPLYSGIHGDVVISKRPRWISTRNNDDEPNGTQVLIPVTWGLIELFTSKHVPRDEETIDCISAHFRVHPKQESIKEKVQQQTDLNLLRAQFCDNFQENCPPSLDHYLTLAHQPTNYSSFEGSSTCSSLSNEHQLLQHRVLSGMPLEKSCKDYVDSPTRNLRLRRKKNADFALITNGNEKTRQKTEKGPFKSKNLMTERNRRKRIKDGELALRALVPKITKMDKVATLVDAADYIKELLETIRNYHDELQALEEEDFNEVNTKAERSMLVRDCADNKGAGGSEKTPILVEVEVIQLGTKDFLLKILCKQKQAAFSRLIKVLDSLGLQVADVNVTTLHGLVSHVLKVEAMRADLDPTTLKHSLVKLVNKWDNSS
ncbi:hypothetical protein C2S53_018232 [Perilla frutescens var. hirtella]|uniref:BHLH domain-containing protein n=1 Tax=Perilla frutescens var. hirtella TaxID=608512 RepID=A0AAD4JNI5_PERFH|nr:hypothetical protein C2S53_018232 [Perilla frutescens var. hirtella]